MSDTSEDRHEKYLEGLNPEQREAVLATEGPLLIIAGAGAGKTKTLTHRILHLIKRGTAPSNILAITFTNKAAREMRERVEKLLREDRELNLPVSSEERPFVSTFHALGVHILKENAAVLGLPRHFGIFDRADSKRAVKEGIMRAGLDPKQYEPSKILSIISREKGNLMTIDEYRERSEGDFFQTLVVEVWEHYERQLREEKALDFDDLLLRTALLLKDRPEILERYQNVWRYVHVDEYQDTNRVQYAISKMLSEAHGNICVVGDSDQNIYSWRGAQIRNILNFERDFPNAKVVLLERNYRSTKTILAAANGVIAKNTLRKEKNLYTDNVDGERIVHYQAFDEQDEARFVAEKAKEIISAGTDPGEIAVLYRANYQSRALEAGFRNAGVPYQVLGTKFFERAEVKAVVSYIKAALNPESASDLKRVMNFPVRGIGKATLVKVLAGQRESLSGAAARNVANFFALLSRIREAAMRELPSELVRFVIEESGIEETYRNGTEEEKERLLNAHELVSYAAKFDGRETAEERLEAFLTETALMSDQDELDDSSRGPAAGSVKLMTVHASKGLEFDHVFVTGLEHGLFPSSRSDAETPTEESEEERRLFYVALTRARKNLYLSNADSRTIYGSRQVNIPSEFLGDIDTDLIAEEEAREPDRKSAIERIFTIDF